MNSFIPIFHGTLIFSPDEEVARRRSRGRRERGQIITRCCYASQFRCQSDECFSYDTALFHLINRCSLHLHFPLQSHTLCLGYLELQKETFNQAGLKVVHIISHCYLVRLVVSQCKETFISLNKTYIDVRLGQIYTKVG